MPRARMHHQTRITTLIGSSIKQLKLTTTTLLSRRTQQPHPTRETRLLQRSRSTEESRERSSGNEVMSAGMSDAGKRIILGVVDDETAAGSVLGAESRIKSIGLGCDLEV